MLDNPSGSVATRGGVGGAEASSGSVPNRGGGGGAEASSGGVPTRGGGGGAEASSGGLPTRGGGGGAEASDGASCSSHGAPSVSMASWAATDASCVRGDLRREEAMATGELVLRPVSGVEYEYDSFDGDFTQSANADPDLDPGTLGTFGVLCGNWGDRGTAGTLAEHMNFDLKSGPCSFVMLQEALPRVLEHLRAPAEKKDSTATETRGGGATKSEERPGFRYIGIRGPERGTSLMIAARASLVVNMRMRLFRLRHDGPYRHKGKRRNKQVHIAVSRILVVTCKMRFFRLQRESDELHGGGGATKPHDEVSLMTCHLHHTTATKEISRQPAQVLSGFWDEVAAAINEFHVRFLSGDFNMALWQVVVELRARGVAAQLAAWYVHKSPGEEKPRIDSTAIFLIGPCVGIRKIFDASAISTSAVAEEPVPPAWRNVDEVVRDEEGEVIERRQFSLPCVCLGETGYPPESYHPKQADRMTQFLKWNFAPLLDKDSPAMAGPLRAGVADHAMFPFKVKVTDLSSWDWPTLPIWSQKLIAVEKLDPGEVKNFLGHGTHMPVMGFMGGASRRSPTAQKERARKADARGWTAERRNPERSTSRWDSSGGGGAAWQEAGAATRGRWQAAQWQGWWQSDANWQ
jgi:hypothetical protein